MQILQTVSCAAAREAALAAQHRCNLLTITLSLSQPRPPERRRQKGREKNPSFRVILKPTPSSYYLHQFYRLSTTTTTTTIKRNKHMVIKVSAAKDTHLEQTCRVGRASPYLPRRTRDAAVRIRRRVRRTAAMRNWKFCRCHLKVFHAGGTRSVVGRAEQTAGKSSFQRQGVSWDVQHPSSTLLPQQV